VSDHQEDVGARVLAALGNRPRGSFSRPLERPDEERAALIGRSHALDDERWLAELLLDLEDDVREIARLRLVEALRRTIGEG
jgi:hypothetical protein